MRSSQNIYLIGPMGVGKTSIGRNLARLLGRDFLDSDHEIENRTGVDISTIFHIEGESGFRKRERDVIQALADLSQIVMATGGGAILREENRQVLRKTGIVIYLTASFEILLKRTGRSKTRPLLDTADRRSKLQTIVTERDPIYRKEADLVIETGDYSALKVAHMIVNQIVAL